jgi:rSAM/selenodomain-associated transferase 1
MNTNPSSNSSWIKSRCALGLMVKVPIAGTVKTRLTPPLTSDEARTLSTCFLRDMTTNISSLNGNGTEGVALYTPAGAEEILRDLLPKDFKLMLQRGETLGDRLINAATGLLNEFDSVCLINSDSPTLPLQVLRTAVPLLAQEGDRVVLGPSQDGGYYLIGLKRPHRYLFERIAWSTADVLPHTIERAADIDLPVELLPMWYDVDDAATLHLLTEELGLSPNGAGSHTRYEGGYGAPITRNYLAELMKEDGETRFMPKAERSSPNK